MHLTEFVTAFLLVAVISALPETFIALLAAIDGVPTIGAGTLLGSNVADLTLVLGLVGLAGHPVRVRSSMIKRDLWLAAIVLLPIILALIGGQLSRIDGAILVSAGVAFIILMLREQKYFHKPFREKNHWVFQLGIFIASLGLMLITAHFIVDSSVAIATQLEVPKLIVGVILVALGTTLPELTFSIRAVKAGHGEAGIGDLLGVVVVDATIVMGLVALVAPFTINVFLWSIIGVFTAIGVAFALLFMKTDSFLSKNESMTLILFYIAFVITQFLLR
jgi:cation:H+ antiporter